MLQDEVEGVGVGDCRASGASGVRSKASGAMPSSFQMAVSGAAADATTAVPARVIASRRFQSVRRAAGDCSCSIWSKKSTSGSLIIASAMRSSTVCTSSRSQIRVSVAGSGTSPNTGASTRRSSASSVRRTIAHQGEIQAARSRIAAPTVTDSSSVSMPWNPAIAVARCTGRARRGSSYPSTSTVPLEGFMRPARVSSRQVRPLPAGPWSTVRPRSATRFTGP